MGRELSRRDDLEAILYMMIFLHKGELPWQGLQMANIRERTKQIGIIKLNISSEELCSNMPVEYQRFLDEMKNLGFYERPQYRYWINQFKRLLSCIGILYEDSNYDWDQSQNPIPNNIRF